MTRAVARSQPAHVGIRRCIMFCRLPDADLFGTVLRQAFADFCCRRMKKRFRRAKSFQKRLIGLAADARRAQERTPSA